MRRASLERQRLCNEAARLNQALQAKDQVIRWVCFYIVLHCCNITLEGSLYSIVLGFGGEKKRYRSV